MMRSDKGRKGWAGLVREILRMRRIGTEIDDRCNNCDSRKKKHGPEKDLAASEADMAALCSVKVGKFRRGSLRRGGGGGGGHDATRARCRAASVSIFRRR